MDSEKASCYRPNGVIDWSRLKELPTEVTPFDPTAISARLAPWRATPLRYRRGTFQVAGDATAATYRKMRDVAVRKFVKAMDAQGWALAGRIEVHDSRYPAADPDGNKQPAMRSYVVRAPFRKLDFRPTRIDVSHLVN